MRRSWFSGLPVGVSRHEYRDYQWTLALGVMLTILGLLFLVAVLSGAFFQKSRALEAAPPAALADVAAGKLARGAALRLSGSLTTDQPVLVPTDGAEEVLAGKLDVIVVGSKGPRRRTESSGASPRKELRLFEWSEKARTLYLTDGVHRVELAAPLRALPLRRRRTARPRVEYEEVEGQPRAVGVELEGLRLEVPPGALDAFTRRQIRARAELSVLERDLAVSVVAAPLDREGSIVLGSPVDGELVVARGSAKRVARGGWFVSVLTGLFGLAALVVGGWRLRRASRLHRDFVLRSQARGPG